MAGGTSAFLDLQVQDWVCGRSPSWTPPATLYVAYCTTPWSRTRTGSQLSEPPSASGYARGAIANNTSNWASATRAAAADPSVKTSTSEVLWPASTAAWGAVVSFAVCDAATGGNVLWGGDLTTPLTVARARVPSLAAGALTWKA